jgi:TP901 family phage tail tape measure protein
MADEIISTLGFNVSQALSALDQLDKKLEAVGESMRRFGDLMSTSAKAGTALDRMSTDFRSAATAAASSCDRMTVSWQTMARIVTTQAIVRGLSEMRRAFQSSAESAIDFERQVALIRTIDSSGTSFESVANSVRQLSDAYNLDLLDAAKGTYQAISNQVGDFAQSLEFTAEAAQFAKATGSSLADSVDLLSGAIKSYGLSAEDTSKVSGVFFSVIDKGRVSASELANTFGRVGPLAAQIGVPLEDLGAALASISVKGSKTAESLTMLRGILSALEKPTPELAARFREMGFASTEAAVSTLKLDGILRALASSATGAQDWAKLFPNIRAQTGASSLTSDFKTLADNIEAARNAGASFANSKFLLATSTNAEAVTKQINLLRNAMSVDLGRSVLAATAELSRWAGGAETVIQVAQSAGPLILGLGTSFVALRATLMASRLEVLGLAVALKALALIPVAYGAGKSIGGWLDSEMVSRSMTGLRSLETANAESLAAFKRQQSEKRDAASKADDARITSALRAVQTLSKSYLDSAANAKRANDDVHKSAERGLNSLVVTREKLIGELDKAATKSADVIRESQQRINKLYQSREERQFTVGLSGMDETQKAFAQIDRANQQARKAAQQLASATDKESIANALDLFSSATKSGEEAATIAERTKNRYLEAQAARSLDDITTQQIAAEKALQAAQEDRLGGLDAAKTKQQAVVESMRTAIKQVLDNSTQFDDSGKLLDTDALAKQAEARQQALAQIANSALSSDDLTEMGAIGIADFITRAQSDLSSRPLQLAISVEESLAQVRQQVSNAFATFKVSFDVAPLESALGKTFNTPDEFARGLTAAKQRAAELRAEIDKALSNQPAAQNLRSEISKILDDVDARASGRNVFNTGNLGQQFDSALSEFTRLSQQSKVTAADLQSVFDKFASVREQSQQSVVGRLSFSTDLVEMAQAFDKLKTLSQLDVKVDPAAAQQLQTLEQAIQRMAPPDLSSIGPAVNAGVGPAQAIEQSLWSAAAAAQAMQSSLSTSGMGYASGGAVRYLAEGGPSGTDTVPAWLSPGEFVVNAQSARRFAPQLIAMNAGIRPTFRSDGGPTYNTTVGDVVVQGAEQPRQTAREVVSAIKREMRRGTVKW